MRISTFAILLNQQHDSAVLKKRAARSPVAPRKKEIAMPDDAEQKEVAATNSMTTGWYVVNRTQLIFDVSLKWKTTSMAYRTILLVCACHWVAIVNEEIHDPRSLSASIDGNLWNVDLLYFFRRRLVRKHDDNILSRIETFNLLNRQCVCARGQFLPTQSVPSLQIFRNTRIKRYI